MYRSTNEKLDREFPVICSICNLFLKRDSKYWPICPNCGHNQTGLEEKLIQKER